MAPAKELAEYTVAELKCVLRFLNRNASGSKADLVLRLSGESEEVLERIPEILRQASSKEAQTPRDNFEQAQGQIGEDNRRETVTETFRNTPYDDGIPDIVRRELELLRRENSLLERELRLASREIHETPGNSTPVSNGPSVRSNASINNIGNLLGDFHGEDGLFVTWQQQVELLRRTYGLDEDSTKILIGSKLKGRALKWLHSKPDYLGSSVSELFKEMSDMFDYRPGRLALRREFEETSWQPHEPFTDYYHDKVILANRVPVEDSEIVDYLIDGIQDVRLRDQARLQRFSTKSELLDAFKKINLRPGARERADQNNEREKRRIDRGLPGLHGDTSSARRAAIWCSNCRGRGHKAAECRRPKRSWGSCYRCGSTEHLISACPKKPMEPGNTANLVEAPSATDPYMVPVKYSVVDTSGNVCHFELSAMLDTGSPVSLIKSNFAPLSERSLVSSDDYNLFGINGSKLIVLGSFSKSVCIRDAKVEINFIVVPDETMTCAALLGRDFTTRRGVKFTFGETVEILNDNSEQRSNETDNFCKQLMLIDTVDTSEKTSETLNIDSEVENSIATRLRRMHEEIEKTQIEQVAYSFEMEIALKHHQPISFRPRRLSFAEKEKLRVIIDDLLSDGIIRPSNSPYASPIVLVRKKNGEIRLCVDFREVNKITVKDNFPTPLIDDHLDRLRGKRFYSKLDLKNGFFHVKMAESSIKYTSFVTPFGQYEFLRMPFGLTNAPRCFQRYLNEIFRPLIDENKILLYLDDILVATESIDEHLEILKEVFVLAKRHRLQFRFDKCMFLCSKVAYLGYSIDEEGIRPSEEHVEAIVAFPVPRTLRQVHQFVGLASFFRRFVKDFSTIAKPLYDLIKKPEFSFGAKERESFDVLKSRLASQPVLAVYSPNLETQLHCDASATGFGAILLQKQKDGKFQPVSYFSRRTTPAESKYHSFELECLAAVYAIKRFHVYLYGIPFKIITDCDSFRLTLSKQSVNPRISRWAMFLQTYEYEIEHRPGDRMKHVDALSRCHSVLILEANTFEQTLSLKQDQDGIIREIRNRLEQGEEKLFELRDGLVYRKVKNAKLLFYVPESMETNVIRNCHDDMGHVGVDKVVENITRLYWFPKVREKVKLHVSNCLRCIEFSPVSGKKEGCLHSIPKGDVPFHTVHVDHCGPFQKTKAGCKYVLAVVDGFTKYIRLYACKTVSAKETIKHLQNYFRSYGRPRRIISDRGTAFTAEEFQNFLRTESVESVLVAVGTPRANGQVERFNRVLVPMLAKISIAPNKWDHSLGTVEFAMNNTVCRSTGETPSRLLYGVNQRGIVNDKVRDCLEEKFVESRDLDKARESAMLKIDENQKINERYHNAKHKAANSYKVGDYIMIRNVDSTPGVNKKLMPKYKGPLIVKEVLEHDRYVVGDIDGFQLTQRPFQSIVGPDQMKYWIRDIPA